MTKTGLHEAANVTSHGTCKDEPFGKPDALGSQLMTNVGSILSATTFALSFDEEGEWRGEASTTNIMMLRLQPRTRGQRMTPI